MNSMKLFAIAAAVMMLAVAGIAIVDSSDNSDATVAETGKMDIFFWNGTSWGHDLNITAYDGCIALQNSHFNVTYTNSSAATSTTSNTAQTIGIYSAAYNWTYYYPNAEYGQFSKINNTGNSASDWSIFINTGTVSSPIWTPSDVTIGWLKPFEDYDVVDSSNPNDAVTCKTANIAIVYGSSMPSGINSIDNYISNNNITLTSLTTIDTTSGSAYEYKFTLQADSTYGANFNSINNVKTYDETTGLYGLITLSPTTLDSGVVIVGYGSDANLALKQALGTLFNYQKVAPSVPNSSGSYDYYSWVVNMCTLSDHYTLSTNSWDYWYTSYDLYDAGSGQYVDTPMDFSLGYYSNFVDGYYEAPSMIYMTYCSYYYSQP